MSLNIAVLLLAMCGALAAQVQVFVPVPGSVIITSPNFPAPYPSSKKVDHLIIAPGADHIQFTANVFDLDQQPLSELLFRDSGNTGGYTYSQGNPLVSWTSKTNMVEMVFLAGWNNHQNKRGFNITATSV